MAIVLNDKRKKGKKERRLISSSYLFYLLRGGFIFSFAAKMKAPNKKQLRKEKIITPFCFSFFFFGTNHFVEQKANVQWFSLILKD